eukprot:4988823-Amphidinium_carterae.1
MLVLTVLWSSASALHQLQTHSGPEFYGKTDSSSFLQKSKVNFRNQCFATFWAGDRLPYLLRFAIAVHMLWSFIRESWGVDFWERFSASGLQLQKQAAK